MESKQITIIDELRENLGISDTEQGRQISKDIKKIFVKCASDLPCDEKLWDRLDPDVQKLAIAKVILSFNIGR